MEKWCVFYSIFCFCIFSSNMDFYRYIWWSRSSHSERLWYGMFGCIQLGVHSETTYPHIVNSTDVVKLGLHTKKIHLYFVSVSHFLQNTSLWTLTTNGNPAFALLSLVGHVPTAAIRAPEASWPPPPFSPAVGNNTYPLIRISVPSSVLFGPNPTPNPSPPPPPTLAAIAGADGTTVIGTISLLLMISGLLTFRLLLTTLLLTH